jgi:hypothetical protein
MNRKTMNLLINSIDILLVVLTNIMNILLITLLFKKTRQKRIEKIHRKENGFLSCYSEGPVRSSVIIASLSG